ncbi:hypothetical protein PCE1_001119 [Barthelona sp. PCE]
MDTLSLEEEENMGVGDVFSFSNANFLSDAGPLGYTTDCPLTQTKPVTFRTNSDIFRYIRNTSHLLNFFTGKKLPIDEVFGVTNKWISSPINDYRIVDLDGFLVPAVDLFLFKNQERQIYLLYEKHQLLVYDVFRLHNQFYCVVFADEAASTGFLTFRLGIPNENHFYRKVFGDMIELWKVITVFQKYCIKLQHTLAVKNVMQSFTLQLRQMPSDIDALSRDDCWIWLNELRRRYALSTRLVLISLVIFDNVVCNFSDKIDAGDRVQLLQSCLLMVLKFEHHNIREFESMLRVLIDECHMTREIYVKNECFITLELDFDIYRVNSVDILFRQFQLFSHYETYHQLIHFCYFNDQIYCVIRDFVFFLSYKDRYNHMLENDDYQIFNYKRLLHLFKSHNLIEFGYEIALLLMKDINAYYQTFNHFLISVKIFIFLLKLACCIELNPALWGDDKYSSVWNKDGFLVDYIVEIEEYFDTKSSERIKPLLIKLVVFCSSSASEIVVFDDGMLDHSLFSNFDMNKLKVTFDNFTVFSTPLKKLKRSQPTRPRKINQLDLHQWKYNEDVEEDDKSANSRYKDAL